MKLYSLTPLSALLTVGIALVLRRASCGCERYVNHRPIHSVSSAQAEPMLPSLFFIDITLTLADS